MRNSCIKVVFLVAGFACGSFSALAGAEMHYASYSDRPDMFSDVLPPGSAGTVRAHASGQSPLIAGILPHHFLARPVIAEFFETVAKAGAPRRIVVIGPDHFSHGHARISLSSLPWKTPFGTVHADTAAVALLAAEIGIPEDPDAFFAEHSVGVPVSFIAYYFPGCTVVPLLVRSGMSATEVDALQRAVSRLLGSPGTLVLLSMDFSHDAPARVAVARDAASITVIKALDPGQAAASAVDCRTGLRVLLSALRPMPGITVTVLNNTNSSILANHPDQPDVTSYVTVLFSTDTLPRRGSVSDLPVTVSQ